MMRCVRWLLTFALLAALGATAGAADPAKPKRLLLVTTPTASCTTRSASPSRS